MPRRSSYNANPRGQCRRQRDGKTDIPTDQDAQRANCGQVLERTPTSTWRFRSEPVGLGRDMGDGLRFFECQMIQMQCWYRLPHKQNRRCKRKTTFYAPYCWYHLRHIAHLRVDQTTLVDPDTGERFGFRGLFACLPDNPDPRAVVFEEGDYLVPYLGDVLTKEQLDERMGTSDDALAPYSVQYRSGMSVSAECFRGAGALGNEDPDQNNAELTNARSNFPQVRATRPILNGQEVFINYNDPGYLELLRRHLQRFQTMPQRKYDRIKHKCT